MRCLRQLIGLTLVFAFLVVFPCSMWTFNTQRILLDGDTYEQAFSDKDFYEELIPRVLPALLKGLEEDATATGQRVTLLQAIHQVPARDWEAIAPDLVPVQWVEHAVESNLDAALAWLEGDVERLEIVFQTEALRRRLDGPQGEMAMWQIAQTYPPCSDDQVQQFEAYLAGETGAPFPYCRPESSALSGELLVILNRARLDAVAALPQELDVVEEMRQVARDELAQYEAAPDEMDPAENALHPVPPPLKHEPFSDADLDSFRAAVRLWRRLLPVTLMIPITILALIVIFAVRSSKTFFRWIGWALVLGCLATLAPLFLLPFVISDLSFEAELEGGFATGGALIAEVIGNRMAALLIGQFTWPILIQAAILIGVGFVATVLSVLLPDPDAPVELAVTTPTGLTVYQTPTGQLVAEMPTRLDDVPGTTPTPTPTGSPTPPPSDQDALSPADEPPPDG